MVSVSKPRLQPDPLDAEILLLEQKIADISAQRLKDAPRKVSAANAFVSHYRDKVSNELQSRGVVPKGRQLNNSVIRHWGGEYNALTPREKQRFEWLGKLMGVESMHENILHSADASSSPALPAVCSVHFLHTASVYKYRHYS